MPSNMGATATTPPPVSSTPTPNPAYSSGPAQSYIQSQMGSPSPAPAPAAPAAPAKNGYADAFKSYLDSLKPGNDADIYGRYGDLVGKSNASRDAYAKSIEELGFAEAGSRAGNLTTGTQPIGAGNAAIASQTASMKASALSDAERTRQEGFGLEGDLLQSELDRRASDRSLGSEALKARMDYEKSILPDAPEGFTLGKDDIRYDAAGNEIARGRGSSSVASGTYTPGANPEVDAYVKMVGSGGFKLENVPQELRGAVAQGLASQPETEDPKKQYVKSQADEALTNIDAALGYLDGTKSGNFNSAGTAFGRAIGGFIPGSDVANMNAALDTVKALVGFDALQKMRESSPTGGALGQITERELAFLQSVQGSLNTSQGTEQLKATLGRIRQSFQTLQIVNSPDGTEFELDGQKYIKQGNQMIPSSFKGVGGDTNQASGIIGGYDIRSYATDPNHERRVASIVSQIPPVQTPQDIEAYIRKVAPNSPVTGKDVLDAALATSTPPQLILAIMQQDSTFGTKGKAVRTLNPGNVGNTDSGATRTFPSWRAGVFAVAQNLAKRKVA